MTSKFKAPDKMYLQITDYEGDAYEAGDEMTWCSERDNDDDVEYVRSTKQKAYIAKKISDRERIYETALYMADIAADGAFKAKCEAEAEYQELIDSQEDDIVITHAQARSRLRCQAYEYAKMVLNCYKWMPDY